MPILPNNLLEIKQQVSSMLILLGLERFIISNRKRTTISLEGQTHKNMNKDMRLFPPTLLDILPEMISINIKKNPLAREKRLVTYNRTTQLVIFQMAKATWCPMQNTTSTSWASNKWIQILVTDNLSILLWIKTQLQEWTLMWWTLPRTISSLYHNHTKPQSWLNSN